MATATINRATAAQTQGGEADIRLNMLNTLLTTPHRELMKVYPIHQEMISQDPLFYVRLAAWYNDTGEIRDHQQMFIVCLCLSDFPGHREVGLAMARELPPYQLGRVLDFIHGARIKEITKTTTGVGKAKKTTATSKLVEIGLKRNIPRSLVTEAQRYIRERENDPAWFDSTALVARKTLKRIYGLLHFKPSERAQKILFDEAPPSDSTLASVKLLRQTTDPVVQARIIVENKIPYRLASTVVTAMTPTILLALISVMSAQELINNLGSLKKRGAMDNPDIKKLITERLGEAQKSKRVAALKTSVAKEASAVDEDVQKALDKVGDAQIKSKGRITRPTAIIVDKSGSMNIAIEIGKRLAATVSAIADAPLFVYAADTMAYPIQAQSPDLAAWEKAFMGIRASGGTSCGVGIEMLRRNKQRVENIIMVTDQGENTSPPFLTTLQNYIKEMAITPNIVFVNCGQCSHALEAKLKNADIAFDTYSFTGDFYSLPNLVQYLSKPSKMDLLMEIMSYALPQRKAA